MISAEGAIAPATCFSGRSPNSRLNPVLQLSTSIVGIIILEGRFREGIRVEDRRATDGARTRRFQGVGPALDVRLWAETNGEFVGSIKRFSENLASRGFEPYRDRHARGFRGLGLRQGGSGQTEMEF